MGLPIIFLTAKGDESDVLLGLGLGADDYLTKDISVDYLVIRIEALLKRFETLTKTAAGSKQSAGEVLRIDEEQQALYWRQRKVGLTLAQFWITKTLALNPGQAKNAGQLMRAANILVEPNTIAAHIKSIRARFRAIDPTFNCIRTERSMGYRWMNE